MIANVEELKHEVRAHLRNSSAMRSHREGFERALGNALADPYVSASDKTELRELLHQLASIGRA